MPEPKSEYGCYVFPLVEGDRLVTCIDMKHHRKEGELRVAGLWWEPGLCKSTGRGDKLEAELDRIRAFKGAERVEFQSADLSGPCLRPVHFKSIKNAIDTYRVFSGDLRSSCAF
ncbi:hypothetical protein [Breoghania sp.]|uniref:hypothetical protein n=1 Tax=Breoghania sp. TaxID=2065378 RepID=UPI002AAC0A77|nr:hypothetical protein [Breoghania sp.]